MIAPPPRGNEPFGRMLADRLFSRVAGAMLVEGNAVSLLRNAQENYPAWLEAIRAAERTIHFENYMFFDDTVGGEFADAMLERAAAGVTVRVLYDWLGCKGTASRRYWQRLRAGGIEVRCFNPPRLDSPLAWLSRNHRKSICIDGRIGFISGLCLGKPWVADPKSGQPWRDTGVEIRGPAVKDQETAFARSWGEAGAPLAEAIAASDIAPDPAGEVAVRVIETRPNTTGLYRLDQIVAAGARRSLWLTDAYFVGTTSYVQTLRDAARDGVDVRLLVPGTSDVPAVATLSRAGYRPLLEAGIRVFEWNGAMLHAKTAVADGRWARVGSSNLNLASWLGNWELDVAIEDQAFAEDMEEMYLEDLANATEVVLGRRRTRSSHTRPAPVDRPPRAPDSVRRRGSAGRLAAGAVGLGSAVGAAITNHRQLGPAESRVMLAAGVILLLLAALAVLAPMVLVAPLALLGAWIGTSLIFRAWHLHRAHGRRIVPVTATPPSATPAAEAPVAETRSVADRHATVDQP